MTATLRKDLGQAGAFLGDQSGGYANQSLRDVLVEVVKGPRDLNAHQDTIAVATIAGMLVKRAGKLTGLRTSVGTTGTADSTTVQVHKNGVAVTGAEATTANTEADGTKKAVALTTPVALAAGDLVELVVSAAPTAGAALDATAEIEPDITIEQ
jgi:hypothetical protein